MFDEDDSKKVKPKDERRQSKLKALEASFRRQSTLKLESQPTLTEEKNKKSSKKAYLDKYLKKRNKIVL
jgi:hypothetical protein